MGDFQQFARCNIILSNNSRNVTYFSKRISLYTLLVEKTVVTSSKGTNRIMKSTITLFFLVMLLGSTFVSAQQKKTAAPAAVKPAKAALDKAVTKDTVLQKDTVVKKDSAAVMHFGRISVTTVPESAEVAVDSIARGGSPCTVDSLLPGIHVVIIKRKGYFGKKVIVEVTADSTLAVDVALVKPGVFIVTSDPQGARVFIDGKESGVTPYENAKMKPGDHVLRLEKEQFLTLEKTVVSAEGKTDTLSFALPAAAPKPQPKPALPQPAAKRGFDTTILIVLTSLFVVFGIVIFSIESGSK